MSFRDIPMIILVLATGYLLAVYLLLILAQRAVKVSHLPDESTHTRSSAR